MLEHLKISIKADRLRVSANSDENKFGTICIIAVPDFGTFFPELVSKITSKPVPFAPEETKYKKTLQIGFLLELEEEEIEEDDITLNLQYFSLCYCQFDSDNEDTQLDEDRIVRFVAEFCRERDGTFSVIG